MSDTVPEPDWVLEVRQWLQDRDNSRAAAVSAADSAELRERVKVLLEVVESAAAADQYLENPEAIFRLARMARAALEIANG